MSMYLNSTGDSNKFWEYDVVSQDPPTVICRWGRLGLKGQEKTFSFGSSFEMQDFLSKKIREKERKKYVLSDVKDKKQEEKKAKKLGHQFKIQRMQYVGNPRNGKVKFLTTYDPKQFVYVEVRNSWKKYSHHFLLNKNEAYALEALAETERTFVFDEIRKTANEMSQNVRDALREIFRQVQEVVTRKFGAMGARRLSLDDDMEANLDAPSNQAFEEIFNEVSSAGASVSKQVVRKFAALGARRLDI